MKDFRSNNGSEECEEARISKSGGNGRRKINTKVRRIRP